MKITDEVERSIRAVLLRLIELPGHPFVRVACCVWKQAFEAVAPERDAASLAAEAKIDRNSGGWLFLEANSLACYQGYDRRAGGAISRASGDWLAA